MWEKIKSAFMWIGSGVVAIAGIIIGRRLLSDNRGGADRVRDNIDDTGRSNQSARKHIDDAKQHADELEEYNRAAGDYAADAGDYNRRAIDILDRVRERGTGEVMDDIGD